MKPFKIRGIELTRKPQGIGTLNKAIKLFNELDRAKRLFYDDVNWDLISGYEARRKELELAYTQNQTNILALEAIEKRTPAQNGELKKYRKQQDGVEAGLLKLERDIDADGKALAEYQNKADKENLGAMEFYTREGNLKRIFEMTVDGDLGSIEFDNIEWFMELVKVAGEIQADFFTVFTKMTNSSKT